MLYGASIPITRITPACAGSTNLVLPITLEYQDHPRLRGEYSSLLQNERVTLGSPPLARGVQYSLQMAILIHRITPACAGSTYLRRYVTSVARDHPRLRGEYVLTINPYDATQGSPPLARGVRKSDKRINSTKRITPACAGSTAAPTGFTSIAEDHPRLRGEYRNCL